MILSYGNVNITFGISSSGGGAAFLTSSGFMNDAKSGVLTSCRWDTGAQNTATHVDIACTLSAPLDATCAIGSVGLVNVQGLPAGTKVVVNGVTQRLVAGARGELSAWWIPQINNNALTIQIFNDVNGVASILASATFGIGEVFVGRVTTLPSLVQAGSRPTAGLKDRNAFNASAGAQLYQLMRTPSRVIAHALGYNTTSDVAGGTTLSKVPSGGNPAGFTDIKSLRDYLATSQLMAVCDFPSKGGAALVGGLRWDQNFMQPNWMIARMSNCPDVMMDQSPLWSWTPTFEEAR